MMHQEDSPMIQSRLAWITKTLIEPKLPGASRVVPLLDPLLAHFTDVNPFYVRDVARLWAQLQRICKRPYIPPFEDDWVLPFNDDNRTLIANASRYFLFAALIYPPNHIGPFKVAQGLRASEGMDVMLKKTMPAIEVICTQKETTGPVPAHLIAIDHKNEEIVVAIRGSAEAADWVINLVCHLSSEGFHEGMHEAARNLQKNIEPTLQSLSDKYPTYKIILTGHSMGGGVSSLLAREFEEKRKFSGRVKAVTFASPVVIHPDLLSTVEPDVVNFAFGRDLVCHGGFRAVQTYTYLLSEMASQLAMSRPTLIARLKEDSGGLLQLAKGGGGESSDSEASSCEIKSFSPVFGASPSTEAPSPNSSPIGSPPRVSLNFPIPLQELCNLAEARVDELTANSSKSESTGFLKTFMSFSFPNWNTVTSLPHDIFDESLEVIEEQWKYITGVLGPTPCMPGKIIHVIPRDHLRTYECNYAGDRFINNCLYICLPRDRMVSWCEECNLTIEAIFDHLIESYAIAFAKDHLVEHKD